MNCTLRYDPRKLDGDGLPHLGGGESFYHASFEVCGEDGFVEGVVAAGNGQEAANLLLSAEAQFRFCSRSDLMQRAVHALTRLLTREQAMELAPKVAHRVSKWKAACSDEPAVGETVPLALSP